MAEKISAVPFTAFVSCIPLAGNVRRFTIIYVLGGMWYQMIAPVALGITALFARRVPWWNGAWAIVVGVVNSQIFPLLGPAKALFVQGIVWLVFGYLVYSIGRRALSRNVFLQW